MSKDETETEAEAEAREASALILSITIFGHGCEDYLHPWPNETEIAQYYKNNVRVYSTSGVPDITAIFDSRRSRDTINRIGEQFTSENTDQYIDKGTREIMESLTHSLRPDYQSAVVRSEELGLFSADPAFKRNTEPKYLSRASSVVSYLANKDYFFYEQSENEVITTPLQKHQFETIGIHVTDIRRKITDANGHIRYEKIALPPQSRSQLSTNLSYKTGVKTMVKHFKRELGIELDFNEICGILGFTKRDDRIKEISLVKLFEFFKACRINFVNLFDLTCRTCKTRRLTTQEIDTISYWEALDSEKTVAFGKRTHRIKRRIRRKTQKKKNKRN